MAERNYQYVFFEKPRKKKRYVIPEKVQLFATLFFVLLVLGIIGVVMMTSSGSASENDSPVTTTTKTTTIGTTSDMTTSNMTTSNMTTSNETSTTSNETSTTSAASPTEKPEPEVFETKLGKIRGAFSESMQGHKILSFKGVPYAAAPLGNSRFKPPSPIKSWRSAKQVFNATKNAPPCIQPGRPDSSEDCLFLNIYTRFTSVDTPKKVPVFVFIGGNSLVTGSAESNVYGPEYLLIYLVVLVVVQYRLGALGFLSTGTEDAAGNIGFKDQVMAMKFIKSHVSVFHGDPDNIVLFGGSAGSYSASLHMVSPMSQNLFKKVIMMSGVIHPQKKYYSNQLELAKEQAKYVCCPRSDIKAMVECLRKVDAKKFAESAEKFLKFDLHPIYYWNPVIEPDFKQERFLTEDPIAAYKAGKQAKVPMIVGLTEHEEQVFVNRILKDDKLRKEFENPYKQHIRTGPIVFFYTELQYSSIRSIWKNYIDKSTLENSAKDAKSLKYMFRDGLLGFSLDRVVQKSIATQDVFFYLTGYTGSCSKFEEFGNKVTVNGDDQKYILKSDTCPITATHQDASHVKIFVDRWVYFADKGEPGYRWIKYQEGNKKNFLQIKNDVKMDVESTGYTRGMKFWDEHFP